MRIARLAVLLAVVLADAGLALAGEKVFIVVGGGGHRRLSSDGVNWTFAEWGEAKHDQNDLSVATGFKGMIVAGGGFSSGRISITRDGERWSDGVLPDSSPLFGADVVDDTLYITAMRGKVYATRDGENFDVVAVANMPTPRHWIRKTAVGNGVIIGSGDYGAATCFDPKTNEITVRQMAGQVDTNGEPIRNPHFKRVAFGNGVFVCTGSNGLTARSRDGKTWENDVAVPERGHIVSVVWAGDHFLAHSQRQGSLVSKDGVTWEKQEQRVPDQLNSAGGWVWGWNSSRDNVQRVMQRSRDGVTWETVPNEKGYAVLAVGFGELAGSGDPPKPPSNPQAK